MVIMSRIGGGATIVTRVFAAGGQGMKNRFLVGAGVALAVTLGGAAGAQAQFLALPSGGAFYIGGEGGWTGLNDATIKPTGILANRSTKQRFDTGPLVGVRAGYEWGPWRLEEEFAYRINSMNTIGGVNVDGNRTSYAFMTNFIAGTNQWFNLGFPIDPYIGFGIGAVILRDGWSVPIPGLLGGTWASSTNTQFGYQGIAGIRYNINPSLAFDIDYRYFATLDPTFRTVPAKLSIPYKSSNSSNNVLASFVVKFGAPPPPPVAAPPAPPAPPPVQRKVFLVFFDWDRSNITPEGMQILQQAAAAYRAGGSVQIQVTGYTDRSGSPGYNQRLSERRASAVATALEGLGVPRSQMAVSGRGENDNRVPTADGVREPQNRRVEIVFP
jgi:OOP family OmpA-OmpF porin